MCDGASAIALGGLLLSAATTTYSTMEQDKTVRAQNNINQQAADEGAALASAAFKDQSNAARLRDSQEAEAASKDKFENSKAAAQARETARVSAGEAGVSGVSVDSLMNDYYKQELGYNGAVDRNLAMTQDQTTAELQGARSGAIDRSIAARRPMINRPSYLAAGATIANNALSTYDTYKYRTDKAYRGEK